MNLKSFILIVCSALLLITPCSIKASIHTIFEIESTQHATKTSQTKTIQAKSISCSVIKFEAIKKSIQKVDFYHVDFTPTIFNFIQLARSSLPDENFSKEIEISSPKIPFYLLYKQLKYSLLF